MRSKVELALGEVITPPEEIKTYRSDTEMQQQKFAISVRLWSMDAKEPVRARPASHYNQQIPLIGEHVLLFKGTNQYSTVDEKEDVWFYVAVYPVFSNINENILPGVSALRTRTKTTPILTREESLQQETFGDTFEDEVVPAIQPYEGDIIYQGRFGNVIRLGSTQKEGGSYTSGSFWGGDKGGDPIISITNNKGRGGSAFRTENLAGDDSSLYLTSTQTVKFDLVNPTKHTDDPNAYNKSQLIGNANRIILQAKEDSIILDAKKRITLNSPKTYIGSEDANLPLADGEEIVSILRELITALGQNGLSSMGATVILNGQGQITALLNRIENIKSIKHFMDK